MALIDRQILDAPFYGSRQMTRHLKRQGYCVSRKRIRRLMRKMEISAIYVVKWDRVNTLAFRRTL
jgi:putative transposase